MKNENEYTPVDLTRALVRQYLTQKGLKNTLFTFEKEDTSNRKKISKALLIEMTSMKSLCLINRTHKAGQSTLLQILVTYLNKKYQAKSHMFNKTEPQFYKPYPQIGKKSIKKIVTADLSVQRPKPRGRPSSSQPYRKEETLKNQTYERQELKVLYGKVSRIEDKTKMKVVPEVDSKIQDGSYSPSAVKQVNKYILKKTQSRVTVNKDQGNAYKELAIDTGKNSEAISCKKVQFQQSILKVEDNSRIDIQRPVSSIPNIQAVDIEQEYNEQFQMDMMQNTKRPQPQSLFTLQRQLQTRSVLRSPAQTQKTLPSLPNLPGTLISKSQIGNNIKTSINIIQDQMVQKDQKQEGVSLKKAKDANKYQFLYHQQSQEKVNTLPIVNQTNRVDIKQNKIETKSNMGCVVDVPKQMEPQKDLIKVDGMLVSKKQFINKVQRQPEPQSQFISPSEPQPANKPRTQMRLIGKGKDSSKQIQMAKQIERVDETLVQKEPVMVEEKPVVVELKEEQKQKVKQEPKPVMMAIGKKKKAKEESSQINQYPTKFKFDQNFSHGIQAEVNYDYQPYKIDTFYLEDKVEQKYPSLILSTTLNYKIRGGGIPPPKKKQQKLITSKEAERLKTSVFQSGPSLLPKSWSQGFMFSPFESTQYGLKQIQGGPCGIIAAVQCYYLKHLFLCAKESNISSEVVREVALVAAMADLLWKVHSTQKITLAFPPKGASKVDINNLRIVIFDAGDFSTVFAAVWANKNQFIGQKNFGVAALLYSAVLTKGPERIEQEVDIKQNPLIGNHGHCTQQFVNLILTGKACSNLLDGEKVMDGYKIKGITERSQFGFLTVYEVLKYVQVGRYLKNPVMPIWVICKEFHYHVIFAPHHIIAENNKTSKFDMIYFDGLHNCGDRLRLTLSPITMQQEQELKVKELPLIEQVMITKWGPRKADWNGSTKIL